MELIGWLGGILFAACGIPQVIQCWRQGHSNGLDWTFLLLWLSGEVLTIIYVIPKLDYPLLFNYTCNLMCLLVIIKYKSLPRSK